MDSLKKRSYIGVVTAGSSFYYLVSNRGRRRQCSNSYYYPDGYNPSGSNRQSLGRKIYSHFLFILIVIVIHSVSYMRLLILQSHSYDKYEATKALTGSGVRTQDFHVVKRTRSRHKDIDTLLVSRFLFVCNGVEL